MKRALVFLLVSLCGVVACRVEESVPEPSQVAKGEVPVDGGTLVRRLANDVRTLDFLSHTTSSEKQVLFYLHDRLVEVDENLHVVPGLASGWKVEDEGRRWIFDLHPDIAYSDGTPLDAGDVVSTIRRIVDPESHSIQYAGLFEGIDLDETRALDPRTVQIVFREPRASMAAFSIAILPAPTGAGNANHDAVVGTGPYTLVERTPGVSIVLERRENYWRERPHIQRIRFRIIDDDTVAFNSMRLGEIDELRIPSSRWDEVSGDPEIERRMRIYEFYTLSYNFVPWNTRDPLLEDSEVRRALAMALDRQSMIDQLYGGGARLLTGPFPSDHWGGDPSLEPIPYDPAEAQRILESAGWTDRDGDGVLDKGGASFRLEMLLPSGSHTSADQMQVFQDGLSRIGVDLRLTTLEGATFFERVLGGNFQAAYLSVDSDIDPDLYPLFHSSQQPPAGQNFVHYSNPEVDQLLERARMEIDPQRRVETYRNLHRILARDQPCLWTIQVSTRWAVNRRIRNVRDSKGLGLFLWSPGARTWWIAEPM